MGGIVGFVLFTLVSYLLIVLNVPFLIIPIFFFVIVFWIKPFIKNVKQIKIKLDRSAFLILLVFAVGIAGQMMVISPSGVLKNGDLLFWSAHGHDATWHIALTEEIRKGYPFENPVVAGEKLVNYHFFSDIVPAMIGKYLPVSDISMYFRILPFIYSLFFGASAYFLAKKISGSRGAAIWSTVFSYFAGSFGYLIGKGESVFWATQPQSAGGNPPQIISDFILLTALYYIFVLLEKGSKKLNFWICVVLVGTLVEFKVYAAIVLLGALGITGIWQFIKERKFQLLSLTILGGLLAALLYLPNSEGTASFLIFQPWWYIRTMIVEPSRLNLIDWELRRQTYVFEHNWKRVIYLEGLGFLIFFFGNLGVRFLGLWEGFKVLKTSLKNYFNLIFVIIITASLTLPLLFLQKGVASNTSQFLQYFVLLAGILAGITTSEIVKRIKIPLIQILVSFLLIAVMIPTQINLLRDFYYRPAFTKVSRAELEALNYIKDNTPISSVVMTPPYNKYPDSSDVTPNIWGWFDTAYVSAFSGRRTYFDDHEQVDIMGYDWKERLSVKESLFREKDPTVFKEKFNETNSEILYFPKSQTPIVDLTKTGLIRVFDNSETEVWKKG